MTIADQSSFGLVAANVALLALLTLAYRRLSISVLPRFARLRPVAEGVLFGSVALGCMVLTNALAGGIAYDQRSTPIALAGLLGGPVAAAVACAMAVSYRLWLGGAGVPAGVTVPFLVAALGTGVHLLAVRQGVLRRRHLLLLAAAVIPASLTGYLLLPDASRTPDMLMNGSLPLAALVAIGVLTIGNFLISERRRAELEHRLAALNANLPGVLYQRRTEPDGSSRILYVTPNIQRLFGIDSQAVLKDPGLMIGRVDPEDRLLLAEAYRRSRVDGLPVDLEVRALRPDGHVRWVRVSAIPTSGADGSTTWHGVLRDVSDRHAQQEALEAARKEAERASRAKSDFLAGMSHELRTPMNAIIGFTQLLLHETGEPLSETQRDYVQHVLRAGNHLLALIQDVLDLAKIDSGRLRVSLEPVETDELLDDLTAALKPLAQAQGLTLAPVPFGMLPALRVDRGRLLQVLLNLGSNAVKYNRPGGTITIEAGPSGDPSFARIAVVDTGQGIPAERQNELFQPFSRLGAERSTVEGTGIGLAISKRLVELMGGRIGVSSEAGVGSRFWVDLPYAHEPPVSVPAVSYAAPPFARRTILYIEDNPTNMTLMRKLVERLPGARLIGAANGETGIAMAVAHRPDLVLCDIHLPDISGYDVLQRLRAAPETALVPVVALTADAMPREASRGLAAGFARYMTKPFMIDEMIETIRTVSAPEPSSAPAPESASGPASGPGAPQRRSGAVAASSQVRVCGSSPGPISAATQAW